MVDVHDRGPVVVESEDVLRWMDPDTPIEEAANIAQTRSNPDGRIHVVESGHGREPARPEQQ